MFISIVDMKRLFGTTCESVALGVLTVFSVAWLAVGSKENQLHGIGHISITTVDLEYSTRFYTEILGGMVISDLSYRYHGDQHYYRMFAKEINDARVQGVDPSELGVPDISSSGTYEVRGNFIAFDNGIIQLQSFIRRDINHIQVPFAARESHTSSAYITASHIAFLVKGDVDFNHFLVELERISRVKGFANVNVNPAVNVSTEAERQLLQEKRFGISYHEGGLSGLSLDYVKGPSGEQLEFWQLRGPSRATVGKSYCQRQSLSPEFLNSYNDNEYKRRAGITGMLQGLIQVETGSYDLLLSTRFYIDILGGVLMGGPLVLDNLQSDALYWTLHGKELIDARRQGVQPISLGIPDISVGGFARLNTRFILFDNYPVEVYEYTNGTSLDDPPFNIQYNWSSPAIINSMSIAFQLHESTDLEYYLQRLEDRAHRNGYLNVRLNQCPGLMCESPFFPAGSPLEGYRYAYVKGPSGEQLVFTQFRDRAARILKQALSKYGAISTAFFETNPWKRGEFQQFCGQFDLLNSGTRCGYSMLLLIVIIICVMIETRIII